MTTTTAPNPTTNSTQVTTVLTVSKIASGRTQPGATNWQVNGDGVYVDVDTSAAGFANTPIYVTSLVGDSNHWGTTGASSIYQATAKGFRVYIRWDKDYKTTAITPEEANGYKWHINWIAIEPFSGLGLGDGTQSSSTTKANQLPNLGCQNEKQLRSASGTTPATEIKFINQTASLVKVYWVKADGQRQLFRDLKPGESFTQSTFVDHVWVVTDEKGGCLGIYKGEKDSKDAIAV